MTLYQRNRLLLAARTLKAAETVLGQVRLTFPLGSTGDVQTYLVQAEVRAERGRVERLLRGDVQAKEAA